MQACFPRIHLPAWELLEDRAQASRSPITLLSWQAKYFQIVAEPKLFKWNETTIHPLLPVFFLATDAAGTQSQ